MRASRPKLYTTATLRAPSPHPIPNPPHPPIQSLPPLRGEVRWGVGVPSVQEVVVLCSDLPLSRRRRLECADPLLVSPLEGGRDEWG